MVVRYAIRYYYCILPHEQWAPRSKPYPTSPLIRIEWNVQSAWCEINARRRSLHSYYIHTVPPIAGCQDKPSKNNERHSQGGAAAAGLTFCCFFAFASLILLTKDISTDAYAIRDHSAHSASIPVSCSCILPGTGQQSAPVSLGDMLYHQARLTFLYSDILRADSCHSLPTRLDVILKVL
jgi:hypothetical protein